MIAWRRVTKSERRMSEWPTVRREVQSEVYVLAGN